MTTSLNSRIRHAALMRAWDRYGEKPTIHDERRAWADAHCAADLAMQGLDDALVGLADAALSGLINAGVPRHVAEEAAHAALHSAGQALLRRAGG